MAQPEGFTEKNRRLRSERDAAIARNLADAGPHGGLFVSSVEAAASHRLFLHPSSRRAGWWQVTVFDGEQPVGHFEFASRENAIRSISGGFSENLPPIGSRFYRWRPLNDPT